MQIPDSVYLDNQLVIWFRPGVLNENYLGCDENFDPAQGLPLTQDFIRNQDILSYFRYLGVFRMDKVVPNLNPCRDTISIARRGDTVCVPDFWNMILIQYENNELPLDVPNLAVFLTMYFQSAIKMAEPNFLALLEESRKATTYQADDPLLSSQAYALGEWDPDNNKYGTDVFSAWSFTQGNSSIRIAVLDNGIDDRHPDFGNKNEVVIGGYNYVLRTSEYYEEAGHGTQVGDIIGAKTNNKTGIAGIAGGMNINDNVKLIALKITDDPTIAKSSDMSAAIVEAAQSSLWNADIINISIRFFRQIHPEQVRAAAAFAYANDVCLSIAIGNVRTNEPEKSSYDKPTYPEGLDDEWTFTVGGKDWYDGRNSSSIWGDHMDILAPFHNSSLSVNYTTTPPSYGYSTFSGTSSATPHATGIAALLLSYRKDLETKGFTVPYYLAPEDIVMLMAEGAKKCATPQNNVPRTRNNEYGYGIVNAKETLNKLKSPYKLTHFRKKISREPEYVQIEDVVIAFPGLYGSGLEVLHRRDSLYTVRQYHIVEYDLSYGPGVSFPEIIRAWGRGSKTRGFPPLRKIVEDPKSLLLPLYRNVGWCKINRFDDDKCNIETYLYQIKKKGEVDWFWLDNVTPNDIEFAISVLEGPQPTNVPHIADDFEFFSDVFPHPVTSKNETTFFFFKTNRCTSFHAEIFDIFGRKISVIPSKNQYDPGEYTLPIPSHDLSAGLYYIKVSTHNNIFYKKFSVIK